MLKLILLFSMLLSTGLASANPRIVVIGDSLTAGHGVSLEHSFPSVLQKILRSSGYPKAVVVNAGTTGATTAFGLSTLEFQLKQGTPIDLLVYALGSNDALRGLDVKATKANIDKVLEAAQAKKLKIVLAGLLAPPNYGKDYSEKFQAIFPELASKHKIPLIKFLLDGVAGNPALNLPDGIHPNDKGYQVVAKNVFETVKKSL
ncbi:MAG: arylesterase [Oligoflexales bacterium]